MSYKNITYLAAIQFQAEEIKNYDKPTSSRKEDILILKRSSFFTILSLKFDLRDSIHMDRLTLESSLPFYCSCMKNWR